MAKALDYCADRIAAIQKKARETPEGELMERPTWPMIILKSPKGWTGPKYIDGQKIEGNYKSHQVPISSPATNPDHLSELEKWLKSYEPDTLFDENGDLLPELKELAPPKDLRMGKNPFTNPIVKPLVLPAFEKYGLPVDPAARGKLKASDTYTTGTFLRDVIVENDANRNFRMFFEATKKQWMGEYVEGDDNLAQDGRVLEMLSEHQCEGWLEGYLLTGGHGLLNSYEAFIHIISSMFNQHAKWLKICSEIDWRNELSSLNILLA
eukprot:CAMPEP_0117066572 /NCGR_PEP_ID=MMETSP0472-20121206/46569_1 /TAXON_ID=693140 ORGANISM="Tiarina fusus, Strain LIS" /NCGR_SAMPLE_ID=MMETSP0472 /ASSEMBLY_ACC=CAM_ASM_000603 /LENGTH=265 /DNA_ID=CAMNT_0004787709 /DNA_START=18 /DNA_END=812 /DNA_ORIENTATION=-